MKFKPGDKVICINADWGLIKGNIYTITRTFSENTEPFLSQMIEISESDGLAFIRLHYSRFKLVENPKSKEEKVLDKIKEMSTRFQERKDIYA